MVFLQPEQACVLAMQAKAPSQRRLGIAEVANAWREKVFGEEEAEACFL